jgi:phosphoribosylanthranilate isomerase
MLGSTAQSVALLLAGGLDSQNVNEALELVKPDGIDLASGIESSPGIKDASKMRSVVEVVRNHYALR